MPATIRLHQVDPVTLAVVRRQARPADLATVVPAGCGLVWDLLRQQGARGGRHVALYRDDAIHLEVGVEMTMPFVEAGELVRSATPGGLVATATHRGPYRDLARTHRAIHEWCRDEGCRLAGASWEVYGHWQAAWNDDPSLIETDVFYAVAG